MTVFRSDKTAFIKVEVTKDGIIKTQQVVRKDGAIPDVSLNDPAKVFTKDIPLKQYKGLLYALPTPQDNSFITVSHPSMMSKNYLVEKREVVNVN